MLIFCLLGMLKLFYSHICVVCDYREIMMCMHIIVYRPVKQISDVQGGLSNLMLFNA